MTSWEPPRLASWLLRRVVSGRFRESLLGDILEQYQQGRSPAWYRRQVLAAAAIGSMTRARSHARRLMGAGVLATLAQLSAMTEPSVVFKVFVYVYCSAGVAALLLTITARDCPRPKRSPPWMGGVIVVFAVFMSVRGQAQPRAEPKPAVPVDAVAAVIDAFQLHAVVALGEGAHGNEQAHAFRLALLRDPRFAAIVNDVVLESGNARYQEVMDRFVRGEDVSPAALRQVCETTQAPSFIRQAEDFFRAVRALNATLPRERQVRVLLGDPPIDWDTVHGAGDLRLWIDMRETYPASLILEEVILKKRHALVVYGDMHFQRKQLLANYESEGLAETLVSRFETITGTKVFSIKTETTADLAAIQADVATWPKPSLAHLRGTTLGAAGFERYYPYNAPRMMVRNGAFVPVPREQWRTLAMEDQFDAVLYLGPPSATTFAKPPASVCTDAAYVKMRLARAAMVGFPPPVIEQMQRSCEGVRR